MFRQFRAGVLTLPLMAVFALSCGGPAQPTPHADLVIQAVTFVPAEPTIGQAVTVNATVRNGGDAAAVATGTRVKVDGRATCAEIQTGALAVGATVEVTCAVGAYSVGAHRVEVCADNTGLVAEGNEENNCTTASLTVTTGPVQTGPDLVVDRIAYTLSPARQATATVRVKNNGLAAAGASLTEVKLNNVARCADLATPALAPGDSADVTCDLGTLTAGTHEVGACADQAAQIPEAVETNNCLL